MRGDESLEVTIEHHKLGAGRKCFLIAELSANHDRDLERALRLVDLAADAGWDCVKFQTYDADSLTVPSGHACMRINPVWGTTNLYDLYRHAAMPMAFHEPLFARARARGILPFTSVYDPRDLDFTERLDCSFYKVASFEMTFDDLLIAVAGTGKPVVLSTGTARLGEISHAMDVLARHGAGPVVMLHCVSCYPLPDAQANLAAMSILRKEFGCLVGFSDHTIGTAVPLAAAAMGAVAIEKHITDDSSRPGPDHRFSATPDKLREIAQGVMLIHKARGSGCKKAMFSGENEQAAFRRSAFALRDLTANEILRPEDYRFVRPNAGVPVTDAAALVGRRLARNVRKYDPIAYEDLASR